LPERFFFLKHFKLGDDSEIVSVNGQISPAVGMRPGQMEFWRIAHIGASEFYKFHIEDMSLYVLATDGHALSQPRKVSEFFIGPGERIDAIAVGPPPGEYLMRTISFQNEAWRPPEPVLPLALIISSGSSPPDAKIESDILRQRVEGAKWIDEVRTAAIARRRTLAYSRTPDRKVFMIDGRVIDETRTDQTVKLGDTEQWTVVNTDQQYHSFHIHQTPFLVTELGGARWDDDSLRDTFSVPPATDQGPGMLRVVIPFTDPVIVGRFVYHCHAVDHEDKGMMGGSSRSLLEHRDARARLKAILMGGLAACRGLQALTGEIRATRFAIQFGPAPAGAMTNLSSIFGLLTFQNFPDLG
jgi:FtsP/CotA-like multicopper oxidase with cupredoxin domain